MGGTRRLTKNESDGREIAGREIAECRLGIASQEKVFRQYGNHIPTAQLARSTKLQSIVNADNIVTQTGRPGEKLP